MQPAFFWIFSIISIASALSILLVKRPTRALLALLVSMLSLSVLYTLLHAYFVAIVHLIVYAGAVLILFLFVIMLQGLGATTLPIWQRFSKTHLTITALAGACFTGVIVKVLTQSHTNALHDPVGTVENIGRVLFQNYLLPFELVSILVLIGIFASVSLAKNDEAGSR